MPAEDDTRQRILEAAAQVFSARGYAGATTRALAAAAGVNEVTLFRHFGTKQGLFQAVVEQFSAVPGLAARAAQLTGDYRADLTRIAQHYLAMLHRNRRAILMTMTEAQRQPEIRPVIAATPARQRAMLAGYLRQQIANGIARDLPNPELTAQAFFGMFFEYSLAQLLDEPGAPQPADEDVIAEFVDMFVRGTLKA
ncbi:MAG TPA: TetR/AcrR family transcriptional regulator [Anaerolineae bacterium]|nr:TetR/AcrR family transcriptional regulator [Anaerolineae bacterium]